MPTLPTWFNPTAAELACYLTLRSPKFYRKTFFAALVEATLFAVLLPLLVTGTSSYGAASKFCYDRFSPLRTAWYGDPDSDFYDPEWDLNADDVAIYHLFPMHLFNSISTVVSLFSFWVWPFFSPHKKSSNVAQNLDRSCTTSADTLFQNFIFHFVYAVTLSFRCAAI
jgi:hypothetical protein